METNKIASYAKYERENGIRFVPVWRIVGFSGANLGVNLYMGLTMIMSFYLNGYVGLGVFLASSFTTIMRLWDGVTDPIVGTILVRIGRALTQAYVSSLAVKYGAMASKELFHDYWLLTAVAASISIVIAYFSIAPRTSPTSPWPMRRRLPRSASRCGHPLHHRAVFLRSYLLFRL